MSPAKPARGPRQAPAARAPASPSARDLRPVCGLAPDCSLVGLRILLAEDEALVAATFAELLKSTGCEVVTAEDGRAALGIAVGWFFDLLLTDIDMPYVNGLQLISELRLARPWLPVVIATGQTTVLPLSFNVIAEGPMRLLRKPVAGDELLKAVAQLSCRSAAHRMPWCRFGQG